jgi:hypothetical protein
MYQTRKKLEELGFRHYADRENIARMLHDARYNGITKREVRQGLDKLVDSGKLTVSQERYLRRKIRDY